MPTTALDKDEPDDWLTLSGHPGIGLIAKGIQVWSVLQERPTSVAEAAMTFNIAPDLIKEAVEWHPWMILAGDKIEHEGE